MKTLGENIRELRLEGKMSQEELANKLQVSKSTISNYENDTTKPNAQNVVTLANIFKVSISRLFVIKELLQENLPQAVFGNGTDIVSGVYVGRDNNVFLIKINIDVDEDGNIEILDDVIEDLKDFKGKYFRFGKVFENSMKCLHFIEITNTIENDVDVLACINDEFGEIYRYFKKGDVHIFRDKTEKEHNLQNLDNVQIVGLVIN